MTRNKYLFAPGTVVPVNILCSNIALRVAEYQLNTWPPFDIPAEGPGVVDGGGRPRLEGR